MRLPSRRTPIRAWKNPAARTMKKTRARVRWTSPRAATAAGPRATPSITTAAMTSVTTLRGVYMRPGEPRRRRPEKSTTMALNRPARIP